MTYLALLRGVNVGGRNKVEMRKLKQTFEKLGLTDVKTFIASGNIIFKNGVKNQDDIAKKIESAIEADFGIKIKVLIKDLKSIEKIVKKIPFTWVNNKEIKCDVMFLWKEIDNKDILKQIPYNLNIEDIIYIPGAVLWRIDRDKVSKSKMFKLVGTKIHQQMTIRNPNTARKLYELMQDL